MKTLPPVDVAIAGGGWSGLLLAKELGARTSLSVVVLERGPARTTADYAAGMDEVDYAVRLRLMQDASKETITFRHTSKDRALPMRQFGSFLPGNGVGGAGEHWNGETPRLLPDVFEVYSRTVQRYGKKRLPVDHAMQDWGVIYSELEPYYDRAEALLGISGRSRRNPFEGPRSAGYPTPPMKLGHFPQMFMDAASSLGYEPFPMPSANLSTTYKNPDGVVRPPCEYCGYCERFGCMVGAKAQPTNVLMPVVARQSNVTVRTGATVRRVVHKDGRATGVSYIDADGEETFQPADIVALASWTMNNTRLLLLSKAGRPWNPATEKGQVGRNLTHQAPGGIVLFFENPLNLFMGSGANAATVADFDGDNFDHSSLKFLRGAHITAPATGHRPIGNFGLLPPSATTTWGSQWKKTAIDSFDKSAALATNGEHIAYKTNYLDLDPTYRDSAGDPLLRMTVDWNDNERNMMAFMSARAAEIGRAMGAAEVAMPRGLRRYDVTAYKTSHVQGGTIMGASPDTSVLNPWLQHWQIANLFVLGASAFPHNASGNPTLTILALTMRTADAIVDRYLKHPGSLA